MDDLTDKEKHLIEFLRQHPEVMEKLSLLQKKPEPQAPVMKTASSESPENRALRLALESHEARNLARNTLTNLIEDHERVTRRLRIAVQMIDESESRAMELRDELEAW